MIKQIFAVFWPWVSKRDYRILQHERDKLEKQLLAAYRRYPHLHYEECSDYARERLFRKDSRGRVQYIDPKVQTVEPPF